MNKSIMITGANSGIGKDTARQLALLDSTEKVYLACRNETKAKAAKKELEDQTGREIFEIVIMDVSKIESVKSAVANLSESIDALIMNAGGIGKAPLDKTQEGVTEIFAMNLLGHVVLLDELLANNKLNNIALYAGSEAARGVSAMGIKSPGLKENSIEEFNSVINGSFFSKNENPMKVYATIKYLAALWMSAQSRKYPNIKFITVSPGATSGTSAMENMSGFQKALMKYIMFPIVMPLTGMMHDLEVGAKRFVESINNKTLESGVFYASETNKPTGQIANQNKFSKNFDDISYQDNADKAIHSFIN